MLDMAGCTEVVDGSHYVAITTYSIETMRI